MVTLNLKVSRSDIKNGVSGDSIDCPIAHLFNRVIGKGLIADVEDSHADFNSSEGDNEGDTLVSLKLPKAVTNWIGQYDNGGKVKPLSFSVRISNKAAKALNIRKKYLAVTA